MFPPVSTPVVDCVLLKLICALQATINQHKSGRGIESPIHSVYATGGYRGRGRRRGLGGDTRPHKQYVRPGLVDSAVGRKGKENTGVNTGAGEGKVKKEVIIGGVAFEASKRSLVRKDGEVSSLIQCSDMAYVRRSEKAGKSLGYAQKAARAPCSSVQAERTEYDIGQYEKSVSAFSVCFICLFISVCC